jgi:predicted DCC family thiol-disulfide oxidoreductase YuxK
MKLFYDGACVFCRREIKVIRRMDRDGIHEYIDISELGFDAVGYGLDAWRVNRYFTGISNKGAVSEGPETVYLALKEKVCEFLVFPLRFELVRWILNPVYRLYARWRIPISH